MTTAEKSAIGDCVTYMLQAADALDELQSDLICSDDISRIEFSTFVEGKKKLREAIQAFKTIAI